MNTRKYMSDKIRELRRRKHLSQNELGELLSAPKKGGTISSWETGRTAPDENDLLDLCEIFNVDISDFYPFEAKKDDSSVTSEERELIVYFRALPEDARHALLMGLYDYYNNKKK